MKISFNKISTLHGHTGAIYTLLPSPQSKHLLSAGGEAIVANWSLESEEATALAQTTQPIFSILYRKNDHALLVGQNNGHLVEVDLDSHTITRNLDLKGGSIFDLLQLEEGNILSSSAQGLISKIDPKTGTVCSHIKVTSKSIRSMDQNITSGIIALGASDGHIYLIDAQLTPIKKWMAHQPSVFRVKFDPETGLLFSVGRDAHIRVWDPKNEYKEIHSIPAHNYSINDLIFHPTESLFFTASMDKSIKIWSSLTFELLKVISYEKTGVHPNGINRLLWHEGFLFSCGDCKKIVKWKIERV